MTQKRKTIKPITPECFGTKPNINNLKSACIECRSWLDCVNEYEASKLREPVIVGPGSVQFVRPPQIIQAIPTLSKIQAEQKTWAVKNFGNQPGWVSILGAVEEVGELAHAYLKNDQGIRVGENHDETMKDAVGDTIIYLAGFCNAMGFDLETIVKETWELVKARDWQKNRVDGSIQDGER